MLTTTFPLPMTSNPQAFRKVMSNFPTGVALLCFTNDKNQVIGITINSVCSLSLEPCLVSFCMKNRAHSFKEISQKKNFTINFLSGSQTELAIQGTQRGGYAIPLETICSEEEQGLHLKGSMASIDIAPTSIVPVGDHSLFICEVNSLKNCCEDDPLIFYRGNLKALQEGRFRYAA
jgi:3-hydroxy-9,10-secoandrosta-1,3,5(10)-triene-9,17-dione monooxygenase reductase component